jgi:hypothetical protein
MKADLVTGMSYRTKNSAGGWRVRPIRGITRDDGAESGLGTNHKPGSGDTMVRLQLKQRADAPIHRIPSNTTARRLSDTRCQAPCALLAELRHPQERK